MYVKRLFWMEGGFERNFRFAYNSDHLHYEALEKTRRTRIIYLIVGIQVTKAFLKFLLCFCLRTDASNFFRKVHWKKNCMNLKIREKKDVFIANLWKILHFHQFSRYLFVSIKFSCKQWNFVNIREWVFNFLVNILCNIFLKKACLKNF